MDGKIVIEKRKVLKTRNKGEGESPKAVTIYGLKQAG